MKEKRLAWPESEEDVGEDGDGMGLVQGQQPYSQSNVGL